MTTEKLDFETVKVKMFWIRSLTDVQAISTSFGESIALTREGEVIVWGFGHSRPETVQRLSDIQAISCGNMHHMALTRDGLASVWGRDTEVTEILSNVVAVSTGGFHYMALMHNGVIFSFGNNDFGQLGNGNCTNRIAFIGNIKDTISISAGYDHSMALTRDGRVYTWGRNRFGKLGDGTEENRSVPVEVTGVKDVKAISAGFYNSMALTRDGRVYVWGCNDYGGLGNGGSTNSSTPVEVTNLRDVKAISAGYNHCMALTHDGRIYTWGSDVYGQLGVPEDSDLHGRGSGYNGRPVHVSELRDVQSISAGDAFSTALTQDGRVYAWGEISNILLDPENGYISDNDSSEEDEEMKWRVGQCNGENKCLISLDTQLKNRNAVYLISPSGVKYAYKTTEILKWLEENNTNPGSLEVIPNTRELRYGLEGIVQYQEDTS